MKQVFEKHSFPKAPWWDRYEWKETETEFEVSENWIYAIWITASASNWSWDDDDLRISIDWYEYWKLESHADKVSYKWYWTSASFNWASLQWNQKIVYFILELDKSEKYKIKFYADNYPVIEKVKVFKIDREQWFKLSNIRWLIGNQVDEKWIPVLSFIFLWWLVRGFDISTTCLNWKKKWTKDWDNIKVVVNWNILQNEKSPTSDKYKNFYFSWDLGTWETKSLNLNPWEFNKIENSIELWFDEDPVINSLSIGFFEKDKSFSDIISDIGSQSKEIFYYSFFKSLSVASQAILPNASKQLSHSLKNNPSDIIYDFDHDIIKALKKDPSYKKIVKLVKNEIVKWNYSWKMMLWWTEESTINFESSYDLHLSLHWMKNLSFEAKEIWDEYSIEIVLSDIYDFDPMEYKKVLEIGFDLTILKKFFLYMLASFADNAENIEVIENYNVTVKIKDIIKL